MSYVALYRLWRPQDFDNLIGQNHISRTLANAVTSGRIAHAYLFAGPRGTGKTSTAKILAKALNCVEGPTPRPCNKCSNCERITSGSSMDVFEIDAASNRGIDEIRELRETVKFAPVDGRYKVYIIDEVHMLTTEAFNALLKTLEEPPAHAVFVLATTEPHRIPATIHSRCQRYDFRRIAVTEIEGHLKRIADESDMKADAGALKLVAAHADGCMRDALSILDQCAAVGGSVITEETVRSLLGLIGWEWLERLLTAFSGQNGVEALLILDEMIAQGKDVHQIVMELIQFARSLMLYKASPELESLQAYADRETLGRLAGTFSHEKLSALIRDLTETANDAKWAAEPRVLVEMAFLKACRDEPAADVSALAKRVADLEAKLAGLAAGAALHSAAQAPVYVSAAPAAHAPIRSHPTAATHAPAAHTPKLQATAAPAPDAASRTPAAAPEAPMLAVTADAQKVWDAVLKQLVADGKRSVHACVSQGKLTELAGGVATVQFAASFPKERTEKEDFRTIIEKIIAQVTGQETRLHCLLTGAQPKASAPAPAGRAHPARAAASSGREKAETQPANPEEHPAVKQALMMFGGTVMKPEKNEGE